VSADPEKPVLLFLKVATLGGLFPFKSAYDVRLWHKADKPTAAAFVRDWSTSGQWQILAQARLSANDPKPT